MDGADTASPPGMEEADLAEMSLEQLSKVKVDSVYAASKRDQTVMEAPASVSLVTADEIRKYGYRTLADILRSVRGVDVSYDRNYGYIGIRGFNRPGDFGGRVLVLVDGHRMNEPLYDSAFNMMDFLVDVEMIERVEVVRGPGSTIYGNNAFFGVINVVTRRGRDINGTELSGAYGSYDTVSGRLSYGKLFKNGVELAVSGTVFDSSGPTRLYYPEFDNPAENFGVAYKRDGESAYNAITTISYKDFTLEGGYVWRDKDVPTASYATVFNDPHYNTIDNRAFGSLRFEHPFENDLLVMARAYYDYYAFKASYPYADVGGIYLNKDRAYAEWIGLETQVTKPVLERHRLTLGAEYRYDLRQDQNNFDEEPRADYLVSRRTHYNVGVFGQAEISILTNLTLTAGLRYDYFKSFGGTINPRAGLVYQPLQGTALKLLYGQAYRAPNVNEIYNESPSSKQNPGLKPETVSTYELVLEQYFGAVYRASMSGFYLETKDLINQELDLADGLLVFQNRDQVQAWGAEAELEAKWESGVRGRVSYTYEQTEDVKNRLPLSNSPEHMGKLNLILPVYREKVFAGLELQASSSRLTLAGNQSGDFAVVNFTLFSHQIVKGLDLSASVYNLFDQNYAYPGAGEHIQDVIRQDGRTFRVRLTYRF